MYDHGVTHQIEPAAPWPVAGAETADWMPSESVRYTNRERERQTGPYQRAVLPAICRAVPSLASELTAHVDEATAEIARFDAEMGSEVAPFPAVLLRAESTASSRIEHLTASARAIATAEVDERAALANAAEIVANTAAMQAAIDLGNRVDAASVLAMHRVLMARYPDMAGRWRSEQVWIGAGAAGPRIADYVAPRHESVPGLIGDLAGFMARTDMPVLVQAAIAHAQFENIHPFTDGNGRTGRVIVQALLRSKGLTTHAPVPVSAGLLTDTQAYFDALTACRAGEVAPIVSVTAAAAIRAIANGRELVEGLRAIRDEWSDTLRVRRGATAWQLADLLVRQPVITTETVMRELGIAQGNFTRTLRPFTQAGILVSSAGSARLSKVWRAPQILAELDNFTDRARRAC